MTALATPPKPQQPVHHRPRSSEIRRTGGVRFPLVDSMRAIAALSVFIFHVGGFAFPSATIGAYTSRLNLGVTIFFVISGFLLYRPFVAPRLRPERHPPLVGRYAWHRFLRIVPAYLVALTVIALWLHTSGVFSRDWVVYYGFGQVYSLRTELGGLSQAWTLSIEVAFYVFLPIWVWAVSRIPARSPTDRLRVEFGALAAMFVFSLAYKPLIDGATGMDYQVHFALANGLPRQLDMFALGMAMAVASVWFEGRPLPRALALIDRFPSIPWIIAAIALWILATQLGLRPSSFARLSNGQQFVVHYFEAVVAVGLMLPAVFGTPGRGVVRKLLGNRVLLWIGVVSYGLYLWHLAVLTQLGRWGVPEAVSKATGWAPVVSWTVVGIVPALALAAVSWYGIEKPALLYKSMQPPDWLRRFAGQGPRGWSTSARVTVTGISVLLAVIVIDTAITQPHNKAVAATGAPTGPGWAYVAATYDSQRLSIYQDGRLIASSAASGVPGPSSAPIELGTYLGKSSWDGVLAYVSVYRSALSPSEIEEHYLAGLQSFSNYQQALAGSPAPAYTWQGRAAPAAATGARPGSLKSFTLEGWVRAYRVGDGVLVAQPGAWFLKTDLLGRWRLGIRSGAKEQDAQAREGPPHASPSA